MRKPVVVDLCCGLGGWSKAFIAEGWEAVGFDIERHEYGDKRYPGHLILKSILEINGYELRHAVNPSLIVASPPCTEYSYMAMPWKRAKQIAAALRGQGEFPEGYAGSRTIEELNRLYMACFRIARECGCPVVLENVKGAQPWVGRAKANFGSYYLWGDVANVGGRVVAARPKFGESLRAARRQKRNPDGTDHGVGSWFAVADSKERGASARKNGDEGGSWFPLGNGALIEGNHGRDGRKVPMNFHEHEKTGKPGRSFQSAAVTVMEAEGTKQRGSGLDNGIAAHGSKSPARKAASAMIAEIPYVLAQHIARVFKPAEEQAA